MRLCSDDDLTPGGSLARLGEPYLCTNPLDRL